METPVDKLKEAVDEIEMGLSKQLPALREYVDQIRRIRMAFDTEVREILRSARQLGEITKSNPEISKFATSVERLRDALNPELLVKLERLFPEKKND